MASFPDQELDAKIELHLALCSLTSTSENNMIRTRKAILLNNLIKEALLACFVAN